MYTIILAALYPELSHVVVYIQAASFTQKGTPTCVISQRIKNPIQMDNRHNDDSIPIVSCEVDIFPQRSNTHQLDVTCPQIAGFHNLLYVLYRIIEAKDSQIVFLFSTIYEIGATSSHI